MKIYTVMVDPENGKYIAFNSDNPTMLAVSHTSASEAAGFLVENNPGLLVERVYSIEVPSV